MARKAVQLRTETRSDDKVGSAQRKKEQHLATIPPVDQHNFAVFWGVVKTKFRLTREKVVDSKGNFVEFRYCVAPGSKNPSDSLSQEEVIKYFNENNYSFYEAFQKFEYDLGFEVVRDWQEQQRRKKKNKDKDKNKMAPQTTSKNEKRKRADQAETNKANVAATSKKLKQQKDKAEAETETETETIVGDTIECGKEQDCSSIERFLGLVHRARQEAAQYLQQEAAGWSKLLEDLSSDLDAAVSEVALLNKRMDQLNETISKIKKHMKKATDAKKYTDGQLHRFENLTIVL